MTATGSAEYILAIDLGTGGPKVALISTDGEIAGYEFEATTLLLTPDGGAEQDPDDCALPATSQRGPGVARAAAAAEPR